MTAAATASVTALSSRPPLPHGRHDLDEEDAAAVMAALRSGWLTQGPAVAQFEADFAAAVGAPHAVACSSGTAALHLACVAAGIGPGDAAIVPAITFIATANAVRYTGAEVVFADVDPDTGLMRPDDLKDAIIRARLKRLWPRLVLPVHLAGQTADMPAIRAIAEQHSLIVIEDASHAIGSSHVDSDGRLAQVGACADSVMTTFSLHPVKTITMGEGGVVTCDDATLADDLRRLRCHGVERDAGRWLNGPLGLDRDGEAHPWYHEFQDVGFNYRASELHCALGSSQLRKLKGFVAQRQELMTRYERRLAPLAPVVQLLSRQPRCWPAWHLCVVLIDFPAAGMSRAMLMRQLQADGIGTQVHYIPLPWQPCYRVDGGDMWPGAAAYYRRCLSLPLFPAMTLADVDRVAAALRRVIPARRAA
jgi:UDP-4-amino-4,6-dideoxy-N-acetyl-beta-L-altrosamine transaminase